MSGQVVAKDDNTFTSSMDYGGSPVVSSGTWMNDSGVYTFITTTDGYANVVLITLSSDNKTAFASVNNGIAEQLTKE